MIKIAPSILAANLLIIEQEVLNVIDAGADYLTTNTFRATPRSYRKTGLSLEQTELSKIKFILVKNPGVNSKAPAMSRNKPSTSCNAGNSPRDATSRNRLRADSPCIRTSQAPTTAVRTTRNRVHPTPINPPIPTKR